MAHHPLQSSGRSGTALLCRRAIEMRKPVCCLAALATFCATAAHAATWQLEPGPDNRLEFTVTFEKVPVTGVFKDFGIRFDVDPRQASDSHLNVRIRVSSADMNSKDINQAIAGQDWFDFARFPEAVFDTREIIGTAGTDRHLARGTLLLKGVRQPLTLPFSWKPEERLLEGEFLTRRALFGIGTGQWQGNDAVGDEVKVKFRARLRELP
ncbi:MULTISPECIES: YceI family protein [Comamonas]|jgi:polyisoprenoid-binding protein YceI|uniref:YceI family protein n=2 Tax=Comamonadaceae TaxID=80864 RepID=UPI00284614DE|nr:MULTISPECIES: YceI family protein [Comamonas]MDR3064905.1 YceI family protein [Comamonas sp.]MEB5965299.1 YceI family protein [Comamonas testosteroni]